MYDQMVKFVGQWVAQETKNDFNGAMKSGF